MELVVCRLSLVFLSSGFSGKPRQRILTNNWHYKCLESYFFICTVGFCPKVSALEVGMGQIIRFIHVFVRIFWTFWPHFASMCKIAVFLFECLNTVWIAIGARTIFHVHKVQIKFDCNWQRRGVSFTGSVRYWIYHQPQPEASRYLRQTGWRWGQLENDTTERIIMLATKHSLFGFFGV